MSAHRTGATKKPNGSATRRGDSKFERMPDMWRCVFNVADGNARSLSLKERVIPLKRRHPRAPF